MELLEDTPYYFVGSLKPYDYQHFLEIPLKKIPVGSNGKWGRR